MRAASAVGVAAAAALVLAAGGVLVAGEALVVADPLPAHADAIVILAGSIPDRVLEAADLYRAGVAPQIVVTREQIRRGDAPLRARGVRLPEGDDLTLAALQRLGVPPRATLVLRRRSSSTESEARTIARWACAHHVARLVVVTSRAHSRRARLILRQALGPGVALAIRPSHYDAFSPRRWWRIRRDAKTVLTEYEKLAHYWLREHWTIKKCGGLAHHGPAGRAAAWRAGREAPPARLSSRARPLAPYRAIEPRRERSAGGASRPARRAPTQPCPRSSGASSPRACISRTMSHPPMNFPPT